MAGIDCSGASAPTPGVNDPHGNRAGRQPDADVVGAAGENQRRPDPDHDASAVGLRHGSLGPAPVNGSLQPELAVIADAQIF
ncbi:MAG: hypothetical protein JNK95_15325 [Candidatus Competibacter sp.]|nr:hypothetical protein [Candidatus Competibacter sp.]